MMMTPQDRLLAHPRGTMLEAIDYFRRRGVVQRWSNFIEYLEEVFAVAPRVGLDPSIVVAQAAHETGDFTSRWWVERLNAAGLGITGWSEQDEASHFFPDGKEAAQAQMAHLLLYAAGKVSFPLLPSDDPRYDAYISKFGNVASAETLNDLGGGRWATDETYGQKIAEKGSLIFPNLPESKISDGPVILPAVGTVPLRVAGILWDGTEDVVLNGILFHGDRRIITIGVDTLNIRVYATTAHYSPVLYRARKGQQIEVIGWVVGEKVRNENRWWVGADHTRIWVGGTVEKPS